MLTPSYLIALLAFLAIVFTGFIVWGVLHVWAEWRDREDD